MSERRWVRTSLRGLSQKLRHRACPTAIGRLLRANGFGLRGHRKRLSQKSRDDRGTQFRHIQTQRKTFARAGNQRISIGAKRRELVGAFRNPWQKWVRTPERPPSPNRRV